MARFPSLSTAGNAVPASIFARLREHLATFKGDIIPLQIGDTHLAPPAVLDEIAWTQPSDLYAYGAPGGWQPLVEALVEKARTRNGIAVTPAGVQIAVGGTHALSCAVQALCDRGEELVLLTPHWPLIKGIALAHSVAPVEVGFTADIPVNPRTAAIYVATPNNPDGAMLDAAARERIVETARRHDLWILSDEVYEHYGYDAEHVSLATLAPERTITVFSFAKSYAQAGLRVGYALGPDGAIAAIRKLVNHSVYNVPVAMQRAALAALQKGDAFLATARTRYRGARDRARERLTAPAALPPGGAYLWVDFSPYSGPKMKGPGPAPGSGIDCMPVLEKIAAAGVLLAPGWAFGDACGSHARLCFTGVDEARLDEGIDRINRVLAAL